MRISEILFLVTGAGMLISLPFFAQAGFTLWLLAKAAYFFGLLVYVYEFVLKPK